MSSNDDLLPVGLNFNKISLASQRSRMKFRLGLILSFYRYHCCLTSAHICDEHAQLVALLRGISYILHCCSTSSGFQVINSRNEQPLDGVMAQLVVTLL